MSLGDGVIWNETIPTNDTSLSDGDDHHVHTKKAVRSRMAHEHVWGASQTGTAEAGWHKHITFQPQTTGPATLIVGTTAGALNVQSSGTGYEMYACTVETGTTAGNDIQITYKGALHIDGARYTGEAAGDLLYNNAGTGIGSIGIGTTNAMLISISGTSPGWITATSAADILSALVTSADALVSVGDITAGTWNGDIDHGAISGSEDNDHPQYVRGQVSSDIINRGSGSISATATADVSFAVAFADTKYNATVTMLVNTSARQDYIVHIISKTTGGMKLFNGMGSEVSYEYIAVGT